MSCDELKSATAFMPAQRVPVHCSRARLPFSSFSARPPSRGCDGATPWLIFQTGSAAV